MKLLEVNSLSVYWQEGSQVLEEISFSLTPGEFVGVIGPSGCGKSTLCMALSGIIPRQIPGRVEGEIKLLGKDLMDLSLPQITTNLGIVFQDPETQLFLPKVMNELAFGPENLCESVEEIRRRIQDISGQIGIEDLLTASPHQLSGGQQQIVALAAVLALEPKVLILDEVTSQLDPYSCQRIQDILVKLRQRGVAILMVEHNLGQLIKADRVLSLRAGAIDVAATGEELGHNQELLNRIYGGDK